MKKSFPVMTTDEEIEDFLEQDLSDYIHKGNFKPSTFEFATKDKSITIRVSSPLLKSVQMVAKSQGIPYQRVIRQAIEDYIKKAAA